MKLLCLLALFCLAFSCVDAIPLTLLGRSYNAKITSLGGVKREIIPRLDRAARFQSRIAGRRARRAITIPSLHLRSNIAGDTSTESIANERRNQPQEWLSHSGPAPPAAAAPPRPPQPTQPTLSPSPILRSPTPGATTAPTVIQAPKKSGSLTRLHKSTSKKEERKYGHSGRAIGNFST
ncbi:hypothetical protein E1B28_002352 [Marasmius oreades]|uniref:Uncharacterized protein n=1 Tax=Marasmius oreades TaxID=181124 RepID=A0A9P7RMW3_9AGAR|nr:uncharacterized protein E1B28_002352 [Marasmius oreades]KAG7086397.1 hypothetical protein E1B28_002352 [Marasmius oreades]